mmetsp:Transcript_3668/g.8034  ORF Transcript_3668/g.8034 Transcript_3668/m.8034 type:complete len:337 (+) Transcript_3668:91-1101(+)
MGMGVKRKAEAADGAYAIDWRTHCRRPFRRGFLPYREPEEGLQAAVARRRDELGIDSIEDPAGEGATPAPVESFEELSVLPPWLMDALRDNSILEPTPLQAQALPVLLAGMNCVGIAQAGSGESHAYLTSVITHIEDQPELVDEDPGPVALVLTASASQALAVASEARKLVAHSSRSLRHKDGMKVLAICEGNKFKAQMRDLGLKGAHIVVATTDRIHDMASKDQISLLRVTYLIVDGAGTMMEGGLKEKLMEIATWVRPERQIALFTSTWPKPLHEVTDKLCYSSGSPVRISVLDQPPGKTIERQNATHENTGDAVAAPSVGDSAVEATDSTTAV